MVAISIVIPVYNIEKYLRECLDSIIHQTFQDFEVICINDGSKDSSLEILNEYANKDSRFKVFTQENNGSGSARNNGLSKAQGKYIQFLDGDDYFEPEMLEKLYNLAENNKADIAVCSSRKVDDEGNVTESRNPNSPLRLDLIPLNKVFNFMDFPNDIFSLTGSIPWNKLYLREMIVENNITYPELTGPDDLCFVHMTLASAVRIIAIDDELINYRYNRPGSVQTYRANTIIDIVRVFVYLRDFLKERKLYNLLEKAYMQSMKFALRWGISLCDNEQYNAFTKQLKEEFPNELVLFSVALKKDYLTLDYLYNFIGKEKVYLWGASNFLKDLLKNEVNAHPNILGIIDKNEAIWDKDFGNYQVFSPDILKRKRVGVLIMVYNNYEILYGVIKNEITNKYPRIKVLDNIFEGDS